MSLFYYFQTTEYETLFQPQAPQILTSTEYISEIMRIKTLTNTEVCRLVNKTSQDTKKSAQKIV